MISITQIDFLVDFILKKIDKNRLVNLFGKEFNFTEFNELLDEAIVINANNFNNQIFRKLFWYLPTILSTEEKDAIFKKYLTLPNGHCEHEEMLDYFNRSFINPDDNVKLLTDLIVNVPEYIRQGSGEDVFKMKCLFTIAKQPTQKARTVLLEFANSNDKNIAEMAKFYLAKP